MEKLNFILALIGALAWIPTIIVPLIKNTRKIKCKVLDAKILTGAVNRKSFSTEIYKGTILLLCVNFYTSGIDYFANKTKVTIYTQNNKFSARLLQYSETQCKEDDGTIVNYIVDESVDYSKDMLIKSNCRNIKYISIFIDDSNIQSVDEIIKIELKLSNGTIFTRMISLYRNDYIHNIINMIDKTKSAQG